MLNSKRWLWLLCLCVLTGCSGDETDDRSGDERTRGDDRAGGDTAGDTGNTGDADGDAGDAANGDTGGGSGDDNGDPGGDAPSGDPNGGDSVATPPTVVATLPTANQRDVALDATVSLTFDQAMQSTGFTPSTIVLIDFDSSTVDRQLSYDDASFTLTSSPLVDETLVPLSPYRLTASAAIRAATGLALGIDFELSFVTTTFAGLNSYQELAEAYAPVIYAQVRAPSSGSDMTHRIDQFTSLDFDGDWDVTNNLTHALDVNQPIPAHAYFNVLETETHYFIQYVLYYPLGVDDRNDEAGDAVAHDFSHSVVVVQKLDSDPLGRFVMAEGLGEGQVWAFVLASYPDTGCGEAGEPPCGGVVPALTDVTVRFDGSTLEQDTGGTPRRYPMYVVAAGHPSCVQPAYDPEGMRLGNLCVHDLNPFSDDYSRVLRLGDGGPWTAGAGARELTYSLSSFLEAYWANRGNETVFADTQQYVPPPGGAGASARVPTSLGAPITPVRAPPFVAGVDAGRACGGCSRVGVWFIDPYWEVAGHVDFVSGHPASANYCFNPFLGIDIRGQAGCE